MTILQERDHVIYFRRDREGKKIGPPVRGRIVWTSYTAVYIKTANGIVAAARSRVKKVRKGYDE